MKTLQLAYSDCETSFAMDHDFFKLPNILDDIGLKFPLENWRCDDLNTISPFAR
jgi:hypothetical protein